MAIFEDLGLEVKILVNNSPLEEYEDKEAGSTDDEFGEDIRKCRRYVEVIENAEFAVQLRVIPTNDYLNNANERLLFVLDLDGQEDLEDQIMDLEHDQYLVEGKTEYDGQTRLLRKFRFTTVATVDDDDTERVNKDGSTARHLGLIRVRVWRGKVGESRESTPDSESSGSSGRCETAGFDDVDTQLSEKALKGKALSHRATLSAAVPYPHGETERFVHVDPLEIPYAVFYFKYRSKAVLQEELIIPRSRETSRLPVDLDSLPLRDILRLARESVDNLPLHEIRRLAQLQLLSSKEGSSISGDAVKREAGEDQKPQRPRKLVKMGNGREAVDLTNDD